MADNARFLMQIRNWAASSRPAARKLQTSTERDTLVLDAAEETLVDGRSRIPGLRIDERGTPQVRVSDVQVTTSEAAQQLGKSPGHYITIEAPELRKRNRTVEDEVSAVLADELQRLINLTADSVVLVVGLGNEQATPDALGPRVLEQLLITRHVRELVPQDLRGKLRAVCGIAPGVLGTTGIETGEIIRGIVEHVNPDVVVAIDSLASQSIERMLTTIQLADTGIQPASGVGGKRVGVTKQVLGVPVVALGIPTVVHALTIASETIDLLSERFHDQGYYGHLQTLTPVEQRQVVQEAVGPLFGDLMVTAKDIDVYIEDISQVVASGVNAALHPGVALDDSHFLGDLF
jgi:spore protease